MPLLTKLRSRLVAGVTGPFDHAEYPLAHTLDHQGDAGLFGPDSVTWRVVGDVAAFIGGVRALLIQAAHPEVAAGVADHSRYRQDPLGRLSRTSAYVTATAYGAEPEVVRAVAAVKGAHRRIRGTSHRGQSYTAETPEFAAWVHNALTDSFLVAYREYGRERLTGDEADAYVNEQAELGKLLAARPTPKTADGLHRWIITHPALAASPGMKDAIAFLRKPPLSLSQRIGYRILFQAAVATLNPRIRSILGVRRHPGAKLAGRLTTRLLRWALGASPTWKLALIRVNRPVPDGLFIQPLPVSPLASQGS